MGAHHAPAHVARHTRPAHASSSSSNRRLGRLAGHGVLTASAALAMTGAGAGAALAHDAQPSAGLLADSDSSLLCGILGGDRCSSDSESSSETTDDTTGSVFDRFDAGTDTTGADRPSADSVDSGSSRSTERSSDAVDTRDGAVASRPSSTGSEATPSQQRSAPQQQASQLDTPPPPGQVRSINLPN